MTAPAPRPLVLARIRELGQAEVARRVCDHWGWTPHDAASRLSRWMKESSERGFKDMSSGAFLALLVALDLTIVRNP